MNRSSLIVLVMVGLGCFLHWWSGNAWLAPVPMLVLVPIVFARGWFPAEKRAERVTALGLFRVYVVYFVVSLWCALLLFPFSYLVFGLQLSPLLPYAPLVLPTVFSIKPDPHSFDPISKAIFRVAYDPALHLCVLFFAKAFRNWRLNSLYTIVSDERDILLGALPFASDVSELQKQGVVAVVNMCEEWEGPVEEYKARGIEQLRLPVVDGDMPTLEQLVQAVQFAHRFLGPEAKRAAQADPTSSSNPAVFVHCRCGMGRSASVVLALLMLRTRASSRHHAKVILDAIRSKRPEVAAGVGAYRSIRQWRRLIAKKGDDAIRVTFPLDPADLKTTEISPPSSPTTPFPGFAKTLKQS